MGKTTISWTDISWNPVTGCTQVSPGCDNCYALRIAERLRGTKGFPVGFDMQLRPHTLLDPLSWKAPRRVFVGSMSDLFHRDIPDDYLRSVWQTMMEADHHTYQVLTKRAHRMAHKIQELELPTAPHIWLGVSVENQRMADSRMPALCSIPAGVRFVSAEPLLCHVDVCHWLDRIDWVIVGGESGPGRRPMDWDWARSLRDQCQTYETPFFFKQGSAHRPGKDRLLDGRTYQEYPVVPPAGQQALLV